MEVALRATLYLVVITKKNVKSGAYFKLNKSFEIDIIQIVYLEKPKYEMLKGISQGHPGIRQHRLDLNQNL